VRILSKILSATISTTYGSLVARACITCANMWDLSMLIRQRVRGCFVDKQWHLEQRSNHLSSLQSLDKFLNLIYNLWFDVNHFFSFISLSTSISMSNTSNFQSDPLICFSFNFGSCYFDYCFLF